MANRDGGVEINLDASKLAELFTRQVKEGKIREITLEPLHLWRKCFQDGTESSRRIFVTSVVVQNHHSMLVCQFRGNFLAWWHSRPDSVIVKRQLIATKYTHLAHQAVVVALLQSVRAFAVRRVGIGDVAVLVAGVFTKPRQFDVLLFAVLPSVCHDLISVGADVVALEAMEVRGLVVRPNVLVVSTVLVTAVHVRSELLEVIAH
jgi:hypothetical protein